MKNRWWRGLAFAIVVTVLIGAAVAVLLANALPDALGQAVISIDGDRVTFSELHGHPLVGFAVGTAVALVALVLVPIVVCVPLLAVALALAVAVLALAGTAALVLSPLLILGWIVWRLARPGRPAT